MPLVRIDVNQGRSPEQLTTLSRAIHDAILAEYGIPERDYFHILTEHAQGQIVAQDAGLGFERSSGVVMIQIFTQGGRSQEAKSSLFEAIADRPVRSSGYPARTSLSATWRTRQATGRSALGAASTSRENWPFRASRSTRCHVVNMSVQTFDRTLNLVQSSHVAPLTEGWQGIGAQRSKVQSSQEKGQRSS